MLEGIFGNRTAGRVLLYIFHHGEGYALAISKDMGVANNPVAKQLERFERAQILVAKQAGKTRLFSFNEKYPLTAPVKELVGRAYGSMTLAQKQAMFPARRRPRLKGKAVRARA